jgi:CDP-diacylglycerol--serine O-phosphatidyltransferase
MLLVCEVPMLALKFKNLGWSDNKQRYVFLVGCLPLFLLGYSALAAIIVWYVFVSIVFPKVSQRREVL